MSLFVLKRAAKNVHARIRRTGMGDGNAATSPAADTAEREIVLTRVFDAPRELVWNAWTDPQQVVQWWGPRGFTTTVHEMDVKPGGTWRHTMHGPDGTDYPNKSTFLEVVKPELIVYSHSGGKKGDLGAQFEATWTFEAQGEKTKLALKMVFPSAAAREHVVKTYGAIEGGKQTLARLAEQLAKTPVTIERIFNAPVGTVWKAITDLDQMKQWYMPALESFKPEVRFETQFSVPQGDKNYLHFWKVTEVVPDRKITYSWKYGGYPGESFVTFELLPEGDKTKLKLTHAGLETFQPESNPDLARSEFAEGWTGIVSELSPFLEKTREVTGKEFVITRVFDAPRDLVFKVCTEPEHLKHWWGPKGFTWVSCIVDLRPGGLFHYCMRSPDGHEMWGKFVYREIIPPERLVFVNSFSDQDGKTTRAPWNPTWPLEVLNNMTFTEQDGKTIVEMRGRPINATEEERKTFEAGFESMQQGFKGTLDQLAEYLAKL